MSETRLTTYYVKNMSIRSHDDSPSGSEPERTAMSDLLRLALREILNEANRASSEFVSLCVTQHIDDMSTRGSQASIVFASLSKIQSWAEAIEKEQP